MDYAIDENSIEKAKTKSVLIHALRNIDQAGDKELYNYAGNLLSYFNLYDDQITANVAHSIKLIRIS